MTIKRKTQLNLSGSHRNVDADIAWIGSNLYVTGSSEFSGSVNVDDYVSASGDITSAGVVSGSTGRFTYLSGALSASSTGLPFLVAGSNVTTTFSHTDLNWTIAATSGGSVAGSDTQVQFNQNGAFAASSSLTHTSGTLGVHAISGSLTSSGTVFGDIAYDGNILKINTNVLVTQSLMVFDGVDSALGFGGVTLANNAQLNMFSGSLGEDPPFGINPSSTPDQVQVNIRGELNVNSGSLHVNSGSNNDQSFTIEPSTTAARVNVIFDRTGSTESVLFGGINIRPLYSSMTTVGSAGTIMSGSLLSFNATSGPNSVGKIDFNVTAVQKNTDNYGSWTFSTTVAKDTAGATSVIAYSELDAATSGSDAATWDVNINSNAVIYCTGSAGAEIQWYAHVTKKMFLSGSGLITY